MREGIEIDVTADDRARLGAIVADRNSPQKHGWRAQIILATAEGCGTAEVMRRAGVSKPCVWRWQERFMTAGVDGLLRDRTRPSRIPPLPRSVVETVVTRTLDEAPPDGATHWTAPAMAKATGVSVSSVQRIWRSHGLRPHQIRAFKLPADPSFATKVEDIVGLYVDPPAHAVVLSIDEKSQIQALDRTQPGLPIRLSGIAAPETSNPGGPEATAAMRELVAGRELRCELDGSRTHDRCAGVCFLDDADIGAELVRMGLARDCPRFSGGRYTEVERAAAAAGATIGTAYRLPGYCRPR